METSTSLLDQLRQSPDQDSWRRLTDLYRPLILSWLQRDPFLANDAEDLVQEILMVVHGELPGFERQRTGSFRKWLRAIMNHQVQGHRRKRRSLPQALGVEPDEGPFAQLVDDRSELAQRWDQEHDEYVVGCLLKVIADEFIDLHVRAFRRHVLDGASAAETAKGLGVSVDVVWKAKSRILARLRELGEGLLD